jgi:hypothetical protein
MVHVTQLQGPRVSDSFSQGGQPDRALKLARAADIDLTLQPDCQQAWGLIPPARRQRMFAVPPLIARNGVLEEAARLRAIRGIYWHLGFFDGQLHILFGVQTSLRLRSWTHLPGNLYNKE